MAELLTPEGASQMQMLAALEVARAQAQLLRVAAVRKALLAALDLQSPSLEQVRRLVALERYECRAHRQRRSAAGRLCGTELMDGGVEEQTQIWQNEPNLIEPVCRSANGELPNPVVA
ncbi:hypothetical protein [Bradyrhizobium commune]|uniref:Uncharacterized protein n=1 Tax=Bradyrhizobium commune TaxID=83627 RepID=A0A7S9D4D8_9BRAD|nr:hypothetical protein [Bradyrhizobium commune]QPF90214.1 hypothetical protein IC761_27440 [Bradyrhizobium commune]